MQVTFRLELKSRVCVLSVAFQTMPSPSLITSIALARGHFAFTANVVEPQLMLEEASFADVGSAGSSTDFVGVVPVW